MTRYQRQQAMRRELLAHKSERNRGDYLVGVVGVVGCVMFLIIYVLEAI